MSGDDLAGGVREMLAADSGPEVRRRLREMLAAAIDELPSSVIAELPPLIAARAVLLLPPPDDAGRVLIAMEVADAYGESLSVLLRDSRGNVRILVESVREFAREHGWHVARERALTSDDEADAILASGSSVGVLR